MKAWQQFKLKNIIADDSETEDMIKNLASLKPGG